MVGKGNEHPFNLPQATLVDVGFYSGTSAWMYAGRIDQQLLASAQRRADLSEGLPSEARKRRLTGWLLRRGHDWDTVSKLIALLKL